MHSSEDDVHMEGDDKKGTRPVILARQARPDVVLVAMVSSSQLALIEAV